MVERSKKAEECVVYVAREEISNGNQSEAGVLQNGEEGLAGEGWAYAAFT